MKKRFRPLFSRQPHAVDPSINFAKLEQLVGVLMQTSEKQHAMLLAAENRIDDLESTCNQQQDVASHLQDVISQLLLRIQKLEEHTCSRDGGEGWELWGTNSKIWHFPDRIATEGGIPKEQNIQEAKEDIMGGIPKEQNVQEVNDDIMSASDFVDDQSSISSRPSWQDAGKAVAFDFYMNKSRGEQITDDIAAAAAKLSQLKHRQDDAQYASHQVETMDSTWKPNLNGDFLLRASKYTIESDLVETRDVNPSDEGSTREETPKPLHRVAKAKMRMEANTEFTSKYTIESDLKTRDDNPLYEGSKQKEMPRTWNRVAKTKMGMEASLERLSKYTVESDLETRDDNPLDGGNKRDETPKTLNRVAKAIMQMEASPERTSKYTVESDLETRDDNPRDEGYTPEETPKTLNRVAQAILQMEASTEHLTQKFQRAATEAEVNALMHWRKTRTGQRNRR